MYKYHSSLGNTKIQCPPSYDLVLSCTSVLPNILKMEKLTIQGKYKILKLLPLKTCYTLSKTIQHVRRRGLHYI